MSSTLQGQTRPADRRVNPKYGPLLVPAIMAIAMSFTMSLVQTIARLGFARTWHRPGSPRSPSAWPWRYPRQS